MAEHADQRVSFIEQVGPQPRLLAELRRLESRDFEIWLLVAFAIGVFLLGILSFFFPRNFWLVPTVDIKLSPQVLFAIMMFGLLVALFAARRELELKKLRLANLESMLTARNSQSSGLIDTVTNVLNRAFLHEILQGEIQRSERNNRPLTLVMCDVDGFKQVNDRYGHLTGDFVLAQIAGIIKSCARGSDHVIRYGGDEFLVVLPETDEAGAETVRERIQQKLQEWDRNNRFGDTPISVSAGIYLHVAGQTPEKDVAEADIRMYALKLERHRQGLPRRTGTQ
ncbi:MAG TPA: GGDEF domain-containing protein [Terriglobia bacterium]|nr:GGDEF domain-containing protein [Terriglobia bacterium]